MHPQALALRSYHFQKVGKKPELTLLWEPEDPEQEPARQVRTPPHAAVSPLLPPGSSSVPHLPPALPRRGFFWTPTWGCPLWAALCPSEAGILNLRVL